MIQSVITSVVLAASVLWFGAGFVQFTVRSRGSARGLVPRQFRDHALVDVVAGLLRFLGGLNLAFAVLALLLLTRRDTFASSAVLASCLLVFAVAHVSQFAVNVPLAQQERRGREPLWPVLHGTMLIIFVGDGLLACANAALALTGLLHQ